MSMGNKNICHCHCHCSAVVAPRIPNIGALSLNPKTIDAEARERELQDLYDNYDYCEFYYYRNRPPGKKKKRNTKANMYEMLS